jgi:hypothetical protein
MIVAWYSGLQVYKLWYTFNELYRIKEDRLDDYKLRLGLNSDNDQWLIWVNAK